MDDDDDPELRRATRGSSLYLNDNNQTNYSPSGPTDPSRPADSIQSNHSATGGLISETNRTTNAINVLSSLVFSQQRQQPDEWAPFQSFDERTTTTSDNNQMDLQLQQQRQHRQSSTWSLLVETLFYSTAANGTGADGGQLAASLMFNGNSTMPDLLQQQQQLQLQLQRGEFQVQWANLLLALILIMLMLTTAVGNLFVIVAILIEKNLHTVGNYLVLSLAIADLLVALLVMPLAGIYQILEKWTLGILLCDIWTSADVFCCTASILHLLAIALDRYWAVTRVDYIRCQRNERRILFMIFLVWITASIISLAPIFGWKDEQFEYRITHEKECLISQDIGYQIFATCTTFYFPLILTLIFYWKIYQVARKRIRRKLDNRAKVAVQHPSSSSSAVSSPSSKKLLNQTAASGKRKLHLKENNNKPTPPPPPPQCSSWLSPTPECQSKAKCSEQRQPADPSDSECRCLCHSLAPPRGTIDDNQLYNRKLKQNLAADLESPKSATILDLRGKLDIQQRRQKDNNSSAPNGECGEEANGDGKNNAICAQTGDAFQIGEKRKQPREEGEEPFPGAGDNSVCQRKQTNSGDTFELQQQQNGFIGQEEQRQRPPNENDLISPQQSSNVGGGDGTATTTTTELGEKSNSSQQLQHSAGQPRDREKSANKTNGDGRENMAADRCPMLALADDGNETNWIARPAVGSITASQRRQQQREAEHEATALGGPMASAGGVPEGNTDGDEHQSQPEIIKLSRTINLDDGRTCPETNEQRQHQQSHRRKSSIGQQRQLFYGNHTHTNHRANLSSAQRKRNSTATSNESDNLSHNLLNDSSSSQFSLSIVHCDNEKTTTSLMMITNQQHSSLCDDIDCCACDCNCDATTTSGPLINDTNESLDLVGGNNGNKKSNLSRFAKNQSAPNVSNETQVEHNQPRQQSGETGRRESVIVSNESSTGKLSDAKQAAPTTELSSSSQFNFAHKQTELRELDGKVSCDVVAGSTTYCRQDDREAKGGQQTEGPKASWPARVLSSLAGVLLANRVIAICWRQLGTRLLNRPTANLDQQQHQTGCTILVDRFGKSSLAANGISQAAGRRCSRCLCATTKAASSNQSNLSDGHRVEEHLANWRNIAKQNHSQLSLDENDLMALNSLDTKPTNLIVAASTANIAAVTTTVRPNNIVGGPQVATTTPTTPATSTSQQQHAHNQSMSIEGVESKRERKAAKTLSIITGVFVMCWLPFFIMAITMPLLQLRPHKYLFAVLLWLGYVNSMLNPIIYTIFSPDFRKAFKHLLCGMQLDNNGKDTNGMGRRLRPGQSSVGHSVENGTSTNEWDRIVSVQSGYLAGLRQRLSQIHPALAALCCCCCCCCMSRGANYNNIKLAKTTNKQRFNKTTAVEPPSVSWCNNSNNNNNNPSSNSPIQGSGKNCLTVSSVGRFGGADNNSGSFEDSHCTVDTMASSSMVNTTPINNPSLLVSTGQTPTRPPAAAAQMRRPMSSITNNF